MPELRGQPAQGVQRCRCGVQGFRLLPDRQPRVVERVVVERLRLGRQEGAVDHGILGLLVERLVRLGLLRFVFVGLFGFLVFRVLFFGLFVVGFGLVFFVVDQRRLTAPIGACG